jgi:dephospho-CoA kinase
MLRLGLTGGIGSGKSTLARLLADRGADLIDADAISRSTTAAGGSALPAIQARFGAEMVGADGALDRDRMRARVFADPTARQALEAIVHPLVGRAMAHQLSLCTSPCVVFDIPLLAESPHWPGRLDKVLVVDCSEATQLRRVQARNGWPAETVRSVMAQQAPRERRLTVADLVVFNDTDDLPRLARMADGLARRFGL